MSAQVVPACGRTAPPTRGPGSLRPRRQGLGRTRLPALSPAGLVQEELDRVLGRSRPPRPEDQGSLPYTNAVVHEVQRFVNPLPHVPRCTTADTRLCGYLFPKVGWPLAHSPGPAAAVILLLGVWGTPGCLMLGSHGRQERGFRATELGPRPVA